MKKKRTDGNRPSLTLKKKGRVKVKKHDDGFSKREISSVNYLEKLMERGDFDAVQRNAAKTIYRELTNRILRERAVYLGAFALSMLGRHKDSYDFLQKHDFVPVNLDRAYLECYLYIKMNKSGDTIRAAAKYLRLSRAEYPPDEKILRSCSVFGYEVHNNAGLAYNNTGDSFKAIREFRKAIQLKPDYIQSYTNLITVFYDQKEFREALNVAEQALKHFPDNPLIRSMQGIAMFTLGDVESGQDVLEKVVEEYPHSADAVSNLGVMWEKRGELEKARECYHKALELDPIHKNTRLNLFRLEVGHFGKRPTISLCMIVKNEEEHLPRCLESVQGAVDQIVVVDTGSTDRTPDIAREYGAELYFHPWKNSFSEARNNSIRYATGDWIIYLDADEELYEEDKVILREAAENTDASVISIQIFNPLSKVMEGYLRFPRMWRNFLGFRFEGIVHNQLIYDGKTCLSEIRIRHYGYGLSRDKMLKKFDRSERLLLEQLEENPYNNFALFNIAQIKRGQGDQDAVIKYASRILEANDGKDPVSRHLYLMALEQMTTAYANKNEYENSIEYGLKAIEEKPDYFDPMLTLGIIYSLKKDLDRSLYYYKLFLEYAANFDAVGDTSNLIYNNLGSQFLANYGIGVILRGRGQLDEAEYYLNKVVDEAEHHACVHHELGLIAYARKDYDRAVKEFERDLQFNEDSQKSMLMLGKIYDELGDTGKTIEFFTRVLEKKPDLVKMRFGLAQKLFELSELEQANEHLRIVLEKAPDLIDGFRLKGNIEFALGEFESAAASYEKYMEAQDTDYKIIGNLGNSYLRLQMYDKAIECYKKGIELKPDYAINHLNLAVCYRKMERWAEAAAEFMEYHNLNPTDERILVQVADCLTWSGRFTRALDYYEKYISFHPGDYQAIFKLSECYRLNGALEAAVAGYRAVLQINPDFEPVQKMLMLVEQEAAHA